MRQALLARDTYLVAGCAAAGAVFLAAGVLAADVAHAALDPRVDAGYQVTIAQRGGVLAAGSLFVITALASWIAP